MKYLDNDKKEEFDEILNAPIAGTQRQMWTEDEEAQDFMNLLQGG